MVVTLRGELFEKFDNKNSVEGRKGKSWRMKSSRLSRSIGDACPRVLLRFRNEIAAATIICPAMHEPLSVRIHRVTIVSDGFKLRSGRLHCAGRWLSFESSRLSAKGIGMERLSTSLDASTRWELPFHRIKGLSVIDKLDSKFRACIDQNLNTMLVCTSCLSDEYIESFQRIIKITSLLR